jgi:hypothetical protein
MNGYLSPHSNQPLSSSPNVFRNGFQVESLSLSLFSLNSFIFFTCPPIICIPTCSCWVSLDYSLAITMIRLNIIRYFCDEPQRCYWNLTAERDMQHGWLDLAIWMRGESESWPHPLIFSLFFLYLFYFRRFFRLAWRSRHETVQATCFRPSAAVGQFSRHQFGDGPSWWIQSHSQ